MPKHTKTIILYILLLCLALSGCSSAAPESFFGGVWQGVTDFFAQFEDAPPDPSAFLNEYIGHLMTNNFSSAYGMLASSTRGNITLKQYADRHENLFNAIELEDIRLSLGELSLQRDTYTQEATITYVSPLLGDIAQEISFSLAYDEPTDRFSLYWKQANLLTELSSVDTIRFTTLYPKRGEILGADKTPYAINTYADSVLVRPSQIEDRDKAVAELSLLLDMKIEDILKALNSENAKVYDNITLKSYSPNTLPQATESALVTIQGVSVNRSSATPIRYYPQGETLAHLVGYVSAVTKEEMEANPGLYDYSMYVGRSGLEAAYEETLRGEKGYSLDIYDDTSQKKANVALVPAKNGLDLQLSIDLDLQQRAEGFLQTLELPDTGAVVVLDPKTGAVEVLASGPSFNPNYLAFSNDQAAKDAVNSYLAEDSGSPMFNRATQGSYMPGSVMKPLIAAMALDNNIVSVGSEFPGSIDHRTRQWTPQSFGAWNYPPITRVDNYSGPVNMENAITHSDNIYFAWVALQAKWDLLEPFLQNIGMDEAIPFDVAVSKASYLNKKNDDVYAHKRLLATTGYGQGETTISPLQMACIFSAFANGGDIMQPRVVLATKELDGIHYNSVEEFGELVWKEDIITPYSLSKVEGMLAKVVESGSGRKAQIDGLTICGKTGTAETTEGRENAWFIAYVKNTSYERLVCVTYELPSNYEGTIRADSIRELLMP